MEEPEIVQIVEEVAEEIEDAVEGLGEDEEGFLVEGGNSTNATVNGTDIYVDGMNETLNASTNGNGTINATESEGPIDELGKDGEDHTGGGHHVDSVSMDELGEKDKTIEEIEEVLAEDGDTVIDPEEGEESELPIVVEDTDNTTLTNSTEVVEEQPMEEEEPDADEDEEMIRPIQMELVVIS